MLKPLLHTLRAVPEPESVASKQRLSRRQTRRLHAARMGDAPLKPRGVHELEPRCLECGTEQSNHTNGCGTCVDRSKARLQRIAAGATPRERKVA